MQNYFESISTKIIEGDPIEKNEALLLYREMPVSYLMNLAHQVRLKKTDGQYVGWIIDRNINITNGCFSRCLFCNFCVKPGDKNQYITSMDEYRQKIDVLYQYGGDQLLLQGGMHPKLGLSFYVDLFSELKQNYPNLKLHALGPPEVHYLAVKEKKSYTDTLKILIDAGLSSLPGAGAEILSDRVRKIISPAKATSQQWLDVMRAAHQLGMVTSATMMYGHLETTEERIDHLIALRQVQNEKPQDAPGFVSFIPWPFMSRGTRLISKYPTIKPVGSLDYIRLIAISRIVLHNIPNLQASFLTVGKDIAQVCLYAGANDLGSIMIEENVVSSAGGSVKIEKNTLSKAIREAGFTPRLRNQAYQWIE